MPYSRKPAAAALNPRRRRSSVHGSVGPAPRGTARAARAGAPRSRQAARPRGHARRGPAPTRRPRRRPCFTACGTSDAPAAYEPASTASPNLLSACMSAACVAASDGLTLPVFARDVVEPRVQLARPLDLATVEKDLEDAAEHACEIGVGAQLFLGQVVEGRDGLVPAADHRQRVGRLTESEQLGRALSASTGESDGLAERLERLPVPVARETAVREVRVAAGSLLGEVVLERVAKRMPSKRELLFGPPGGPSEVWPSCRARAQASLEVGAPGRLRARARSTRPARSSSPVRAKPLTRRAARSATSASGSSPDTASNASSIRRMPSPRAR